MDTTTLHGIPLAVVVAMLMQWVKESRLPLLQVPDGPGDTVNEWRNRIVSVAAAMATAWGVHYAWHFDPSTGAWDLSMHGTLADLAHGAWEVLKQWCMQHGAYKGLVVLPELLADIRRELQVSNLPPAARPEPDGKAHG